MTVRVREREIWREREREREREKEREPEYVLAVVFWRQLHAAVFIREDRRRPCLLHQQELDLTMVDREREGNGFEDNRGGGESHL